MSAHDDDFLAILRSTFRVEAGEHLQTIATGLLEIEKGATPDAAASIERVFRAAHTLKGAARAVDFKDIERHCQALEEVVASWKRGQTVPGSEDFDLLHGMLDAIHSTLSPAQQERPAAPPAPQPPPERRETIEAPVVAAAENRTPPAPPAAAEKTRARSDVTVRVSVAKLEAQLLHAEEVLAAKLMAAQRAADLRELAQRFEPWRRAWASMEADMHELRAGNEKWPALNRVLDFVDWTGETLKSIEQSAQTLGQMAEKDRYGLARLVDDLLDESKQLLLLPFATIAASFPKLVRDLSREEGKEADLTIHGDDVKIDKRILEEIKDPIIHLLRNSIAHGIEKPEERLRRGKSPRASIAIAVSQIGGSRVEIVVSDDGCGIDVDKVRDAAIRHGAITPEEARHLGTGETQQLIFRSQVTTSPIITELSGRGLGLAIVQEKVENLGGEVRVESAPGRPTSFRMIIPATRSTFRGVLVEAAGRLMIVPTAQVERVGQVRIEEIETVQGRETIFFEGRNIPLLRLADALELPPEASRQAPPVAPIIVLGITDQRAAFIVDAVLDEQEVLVKPFRAPLSRVRNVAAATVLGSGHVVPILNSADLLKSARRIRPSSPELPAASKPEKAKRILVAEDSISSRMLLKSILQSAGYDVKTAVDGVEAYALLRAEPFDLIVSDVEMPRLNGFDLTARIRADRKLAEMPVVLVTALETREDRERGIDAGANAYIVKGSFDQSNLLEAVRGLIA